MDNYTVKFLTETAHGPRIVSIVVTAQGRSKAITTASKKTGLHRSLCLSAKSHNPASGGRGKGHH